jgi:capsule polysaccharide export protein KpsE/RkpR
LDFVHPPESTRTDADVLWRLAGVVYGQRRLVAIVTGSVAILSVVVSLLIPNSFRAASRLLLPESSGSNAAGALLGNLGSAAQLLLNRSGGDYVRYIAILGSRNVLATVVDTFDLVSVYGLEDSRFPEDDAIATLVDNVEFVVDDEYQYFSIAVVDADPQRAADMANFFVRALDRVNNELGTQTAASFRRYVEARYDESAAARTALLDSLKALQIRYGVYDIGAQTQAFFEQLANMRTATLEAEIQYEALRGEFGDENPQVAMLGQTVAAARRKFEDALAGNEVVLPVDRDQVPEVVRAYLDIEMERTIQERILTLIAPMLEQARFDERRQSYTVQVVDPAIPPVRKFSPKRSVICVVSTVSAFLLVVLYVLVADWWRRNFRAVAQRVRAAAEQADRT